MKNEDSQSDEIANEGGTKMKADLVEELFNGEVERSHRVGDDEPMKVETSSEDASLREAEAWKSVS